MILTHFAPTFIMARFSFALPKGGRVVDEKAARMDRIKKRTSSSISSADVLVPVVPDAAATAAAGNVVMTQRSLSPVPSPSRRKMSIIGGRRLNSDQHDFLVSVASESKVRSSQDEVFEKAESVLMWPDLFMVPYVVGPFELVLPYPLPLHVFDSQWDRYTDSLVFPFELGNTIHKLTSESFADVKKLLLDRLATQLNVHEVSRVEWGNGQYFHTSYSFMSWFDDVFAMHVSGNFHSSTGIVSIYVEIRSSTACSLRGFDIMTVQQAVFSGVVDSELCVSPMVIRRDASLV